jgi:predicted chitinase
MPIEEYKSSWSQHTGPGKYAAEISITNSAGQIVKNRYYGRGYIQLTWRDKYVALGKALGHGHEFEIDPTKVLEPETAYAIASLGMRDGLFRHGHTLFKYIHGNHRDYYNARYIINGDNQSTGLPDAADTIERYAIAFEALLLLSTQAT